MDYNFGFDLATGDLNGDGIADIVIGEPYGPNDSGGRPGAVHVVFGREDFEPYQHIDIHETPADITVFGRNYADSFGHTVDVGDFNGDGVDDLLVGAHWADNFVDECGRVYVFYGSRLVPPGYVIDLADDEADIEIRGPHEDSWTGWSVHACDLNGDGLDDICLNLPWVETTPYRRGSVRIFYGRTDFPDHHFIDLALEQADITVWGAVEEAYLGHAFSSGDMDGDGCEELAISAFRGEGRVENEGVVYVLGGSPDYPAHHVIDFIENEPEILVLGVAPEDRMTELSEMTDVNEDGYADLIIGAPGVDREVGSSILEGCGEIYVLLSDGTLSNPPRVLASPGLYRTNPPELRLFDPFDHKAHCGRFSPYLVTGYGLVSAAGDLDGDGYSELVTGPGPGPFHPALALVLDHAGQRLASFQAYGTPRFGVNVTCGDLDGDGRDEIVTGAGPGEVYGPHVRGWRWDGGSQVLPLPGVSYLAYGTRRFGVNVACGDIDGDGNDEIVTGAGPGDVFGPHVRGWNVDGGAAAPIPGASYLAYGTPRWGVNVTCGDIDADGIAEIVTGPGPSELFGSHVRGWDFDGVAVSSIDGVNFFAFPDLPSAKGCNVACGDVDNDRVAEILTAPGPHPANPALLKTWNYDGIELTLVEDKSFLVFEGSGYSAGARIAVGKPYQHPGYLP